MHGVLLEATVEDDTTLLRVSVDLQGTLVNQPPTAQAGADQTVECTAPEGATVTLDGTGSHDPDDNITLARWHQGSRTGALVGDTLTVAHLQGLGSAQYVLRVIDALTQAAEDTTTVQVADTTAPSLTAVTATPPVLRPPLHQLVPVTVAVAVTDSCDAAPACQLTAVTSNEPENGTGDGDASPDWEITGPLTANLRAERAGAGSDRVYTLTVECGDATGNTAQGTTTVTVPRDQR